MAITLALDDNLAAALENRAKKHELTLEQLAISILADAVDQSESATPEEVVARIQATPPNPSGIRVATANLADALRDSQSDPHFDLNGWTRQWTDIESELKAVTRANDIAAGRAG